MHARWRAWAMYRVSGVQGPGLYTESAEGGEYNTEEYDDDDGFGRGL